MRGIAVSVGDDVELGVDGWIWSKFLMRWIELVFRVLISPNVGL